MTIDGGEAEMLFLRSRGYGESMSLLDGRDMILLVMGFQLVIRRAQARVLLVGECLEACNIGHRKVSPRVIRSTG